MMARLDAERAVAIVAIQQLVHDWAWDLDVAAGLGVAALVTADCAYDVGGQVRHGPAAVRDFYEGRLARLTGGPSDVPTLRHLTANLRVVPDTADGAALTFNLIFFSGSGSATFPAEIAAVSDVTMTCRCEADGDWRIARFASVQQFRRAAA